jgi:hypothetical protein
MINHRLIISGILLTALAGADIAGAQVQPRPRPPTTMAADSAAMALPGRCPGGNGIRISVTTGSGDSAATDTASGRNRIIDLNQGVDTTLVFDVAQKTWTRTNLAAAISVGLADESRGAYAICAGVTALLQSATLTIRGARGRVHFVASLRDLTNALRVGPRATSPQPRRL